MIFTLLEKLSNWHPIPLENTYTHQCGGLPRGYGSQHSGGSQVETAVAMPLEVGSKDVST